MKEFSLTKERKWQQAHDKIVKKYVASLSQTGTEDPVATVLYDDTNLIFNFVRDAAGVYFLTVNEPIFAQGKAQIKFTNPLLDLNSEIAVYALPFIFGVGDVAIIVSVDGGSATDSILGNPLYSQTTIEIELYN